MNIINRVGWYKQPGRSWYQRNTNTIKVITVHHTGDVVTGTDDQVLQKEYTAHKANGWPGLSYHFFIPKSGKIYQINNFIDVTWHDAINWDSIGIALQGYFHTPQNQTPTEAQIKALRWLLDNLTSTHPEFPAGASNVFGHRERSSTACPGDKMIWYPQNYRNSNGDVAWGEPPVTPEPVNVNWSETDKRKLVELVQKGTGSVPKYMVRDILKIPYVA